MTGRLAQRIAVIGAGIVGASAAYQLARRGAEVTVLERSHAAAGATGKSFAWINASFDKLPWPYFRLSWLATLAWARLESELAGQLPIQWGGSVAWLASEESARGLEGALRQHQAWGYPARRIDAEQFRALEPHVQPGAAGGAVYSEHEASLDPVAATEVLLAAAEKHGARILAPAEVTGFERRGGRLVALGTTRGEVPADVALLAAGVDTARLAALAGLHVPLEDSPGILAHTSPVPRRVGRVVLGPEIHLKQKLDGGVVIGEHGSGFRSSDASREHGEHLLREAIRLVPDLAGAALQRVTLGQRPFPADGHPIVGFPAADLRIYLAVMHSGITLAPLVGQLASLEILDGARVELLEPYRLSRFGRVG
jgi:glycine/D-amino acid oxidase-like deaminating enzyme